MHRKIIFVTGGARSGKSAFALKMALDIPGRKAYIATAEALDEEMRERIERHKAQRGKAWDTCEEPVKIADLIKKTEVGYEVIVVDCLTLWLSNIMIRTRYPEHAAQIVEAEVNRLLESLNSLRASSAGNPDFRVRSLFIVSNEVGSGIVPDNETARMFRDMAGMLNQRVAGIADEVHLMVSGIPLRIK